MKKEEWNTPMGLTEKERKLYRMTAKDYLDFNAILNTSHHEQKV